MNALRDWLTSLGLLKPRLVAVGLLAMLVVCASFFPSMAMDTDPENLLEPDEPARVFHNEAKKRFSLSETILVGVTCEEDPDGAFNPETLGHIDELARFAATLRYEDPKEPGRFGGVIEVDMVAPSVVDHMRQNGPGSIAFEWLMPGPPATREEALAVRDRALSNPLLVGQLVSRDGKALCLYLPLTDKLLSHKVYEDLQGKIAGFGGPERYHIAGLPVAEGAIGVEMFSEMVVATPLTMILFFGLLYAMFRRWSIVALPMIVSTAAVVITFGAMVGLGFPVHILSSMLPIFLMSISLCDSIHFLSEFYEVYTPEKGRDNSVREVMRTLFMPMLYTSLTTAAGFFSFVTTEIPPARIFGSFVGVGVLIAWLVTIVFVPAYIMLLPERVLARFGHAARSAEKPSRLAGPLARMGAFACRRPRLVLAVCGLFVVAGAWGVSQVRVNDNYAKRFAIGHPIREADTALNSHFGGVYSASLVLTAAPAGPPAPADVERLARRIERAAQEMPDGGQAALDCARTLVSRVEARAAKAASLDDLLTRAAAEAKTLGAAASGHAAMVYDELRAAIDLEREVSRLFKRPDVLRYMEAMQRSLECDGYIGKSTSLADIVAKVRQELVDGREESRRVPDSAQAVGECVMQYQQGHKPADIWHYVTPEFDSANVLMQFTSGDSLRTEAAVRAVADYMRASPPPVPLSAQWAGLHYVNNVFQDKMFVGMLQSLAGSFALVLGLMVLLFRSMPWGLLSLVPLSLTILMLYGALGVLGLDYDMPVAVLGAISLGIAVDFAIHFLERSRQLVRETGSWASAAPAMFAEPARAIVRNVVIVAFGFLPMLVARLVPYKTTGLLMFSILVLSGLATLIVLPAIITLWGRRLFPTVAQAGEDALRHTKLRADDAARGGDK